MEKEQYYIYGQKVEIIHEFTHQGRNLVVYSDYDDSLMVTNREQLQKWEETWKYRQEQVELKKIEDIKSIKEKIIIQLKEEAVKSLLNRLKINMIFGKEGIELSTVGIAVANELEKIIKEKNVESIS